MSTSVDNRIVSMEFDNHKFQQNAEATMKTLDQLEASLQFKDAGKGLDDVTKKAKGVDFAPLSKSLDEVSGKFSALEIAGITAIANITNRIVDAGLNIAKSLSIDQITAGFSKYEQKMTAIQAIMNSTGESLEDVQAVIAKLAQYSDDTSYNLSTMVDAMSKFTSYGVDIRDAGKYIMAVGNIAGFSGASVQQASHAFEGFAKTLGQGHLSMQVWKTWFGTARVNGVKIKETFIDAAVAAGTLERGIDGIARTAKGTEVTAEAFEESLREGWADTELVTKKVLDRWGSYTEIVQGMADAWEEANGETKNSYELLMDLEDGIEGNEPALKAFQVWMKRAKGETVDFNDAVEVFNAQIDDLSKKGYESATVYRTFTDAIDAAKDAVSTSWSIIIENITGDALEAQELWSTVGEILLEIFQGPLEKIKDATSLFHSNGSVQKIIDLVNTLYDSTSRLTGTFRDAFHEVFPEKTAEDIAVGLDKIVTGLTKFIEFMGLSEEESEALFDILSKLMTPLKPVVNALKKVGEYTLKFIIALRLLSRYALEAYTALGGFEGIAARIISSSPIFSKIIVIIAAGISTIKKGVSELFKVLKNAISSIDILGTLKFVGDSLTAIGKAVGGVILRAFITLENVIKSIDLSGVLGLLKTVGVALKGEFQTWANFTKSVFDGMLASVKKIWESVTALFKSLFAIDTTGIKTAWDSLVEMFKTPITVGSAVDVWFEKGAESIKKIGNLFVNIGKVIFGVVKDIGIANIALAAVGFSLAGLIIKTKSVVGNFAKLVKSITFTQETKATMNLVGVFLSLAAAIAVLAGSLYILGTKVEVNRLWNVVGAISAIVVVMGGLSAGLALLAKKLDLDNQMLGFAIAMASFAGSALMLAKAFDQIRGMSWPEIGKAVTAIAGASTIIVVAMKFISKNIAMSISSALGLLFFSQILNRTINTLVSQTAMEKWEMLVKTFLDLVTRIRDWLVDAVSAADFIKNKGTYIVAGVAAFIGSLALLKFAKGIGGEFKNLATGLALLNASLYLMTGLVAKISKLSNADIKKALPTIGALTIMIVALMGMLSLFTSTSSFKGGAKGSILKQFGLGGTKTSTKFNGVATAAAVAGLVVSIGMMIHLIKKVNEIKDTDILLGIGVITAFGVLVTGMMAVLNLTARGNNVKGQWASVVILLEVFLLLNKLSKMSLEEIEKACKGMLGIAEALGVAMVGFALLGKFAAGQKVPFVTFAVVMGILVGGLIALTQLCQNPTQLEATWKAMAGVAIAIGLFGLELAAAMKIMNPAQTSWMSIVKALVLMLGSLAIGLAGVAALAYLLPKESFDKLHDSALQLCEVMIAIGIMADLMSVAILALSIIPFPAGITAIGLALAFVGGLALLGTFFAEAFQNQQPDKIQNGMNILGIIASGIGTFVSNLVTNSLAWIPALGQQLSDFATSVTGFIDMIRDLNMADINGISVLVSAVRELGEMEKYYNRSLHPIVAFGKVSSAFDKFGEIMVNFFNRFEGFGTDKINSMANLSAAIISFNEAIPGIKASVDALGNNRRMNQFKTGLTTYAEAMASFANTATVVDTAVIDNAVKLGNAVAEMAKSIPNGGLSIASIFVGDNDLGKFSEGMKTFVGAMVEMKEKIGDFTYTEGMKQAIQAGADIAEFSNSIPNGGFSKLSMLIGDNDLGVWSKGLPTFGEGIATFSNNLLKYGFSAGSGYITDALNAAHTIAAIANIIPNQGLSIVSVFTGDNKLDAWSNGLPTFGKGIAQFSNRLVTYGFKSGAPLISSACDAAIQIAGICKTLNDNSSIWSVLTGDKVNAQFADACAGLGEALGQFSAGLENFDPEDVDVAMEVANKFVDMALKLDTNIYTSMGYFTDDLPVLADAINQFHNNLGDLSYEEADTDCRIIDRIITTANTMVGLGDKEAKDFQYWLEGMSTSALTAFCDTFKNSEADVNEAIDSLNTVLENSFKTETHTADYKGIGEYVTLSLSDGLKSVVPRAQLAQSAGEIAAIIENTIRNRLDIHSISPKLRDGVGRFVPLSLASGMTDPTAGRILQASGIAVGQEAELSIAAGVDPSITEGSANVAIGGFVGQLLDYMDKYAPHLTAGVRTLYENTIGKYQDIMAGSPFNFESITEQIEDEVEKAKEAMNEGLGDLGDDGGAGGTAKKVAKTVEQLTEEYKLCSDSVQGLYDRHKDTFDLIGGATGKSGWDIAYDRVWAYGEALWEATQTTDELAKVTAGDADAIEAKFKGVKEALEKVYTEAVAKFSKLTEVIFKDEEAEGPAGDLWGYKSRYEEQAKNYEKYVDNMEKLHDKIVSLQLDKEIWKRAYDAGPDDTSFLEQALGMDDKHLKEISETIQASFSKESELGRRLADLDYDLGYASSQAQADGMIAGSIEMVNAGTASVEECVEAMSQAVLTGDIPEAAKKLIEGFVAGLEENRYSLSTESTTVMQEDVQKPVETVMSKSNGEYHGYLLLQGMIEGIRENADRLQEAIATTMAEADEAYKKDPHVNEGSPSKHWKEHGRFLMLGLAQGIIANERSVTNAIGEVNSFIDTATVEAFNAAIDLLDTSGLNNPVITPTLDLTEVKKGVRGMSSMFEDSKLAASGIQNGSQNGSKEGGVTQVFNQNNYSPKALDRLTIYRQSKNQFAQMKEALGQL